MRYSLPSRDAICDAIEIMHEGYKASMCMCMCMRVCVCVCVCMLHA